MIPGGGGYLHELVALVQAGGVTDHPLQPLLAAPRTSHQALPCRQKRLLLDCHLVPARPPPVSPSHLPSYYWKVIPRVLEPSANQFYPSERMLRS